MQGQLESLVLSEQEASVIGTLCEVAEANDSVLTLQDISSMVPLPGSPVDIARAINSSPSLSMKYEVRDGILVHRSWDRAQSLDGLARETAERKVRSLATLIAAKEVAAHFLRTDALMVSVSGSTSYFSAKKGDDLDLFCVTPTGRMWVFLARSLFMARVIRTWRPSFPELCFSCVMDDAFAHRIFGAHRDALFARDALMAFVLRGGDYYGGLLAGSRWMKWYFPNLYSGRVGATAAATGSGGPAPFRWRLANAFLYETVGRYIRLKAWLLNKRYAKWNRRSRMFQARIGRDRILYESARYSGLRKIYSQLDSR